MFLEYIKKIITRIECMTERLFKVRVADIYIQGIRIHAGGLQLLQGWCRRGPVVIKAETLVGLDFVGIGEPWKIIDVVIRIFPFRCYIILYKMAEAKRATERKIVFLFIDSEINTGCMHQPAKFE